MENCEPLAWYGALLLIVTGGAILIPYWRRQADLLSAWNFLLLGVAIFLGVGCFEAALQPMDFPGTEWFTPTKAEVNRFLASTTVFMAALFVFHYYDPVSRAAASRSLNNWPKISTATVFFVLIVCGIVVVIAPLVWGSAFLGPIMSKLRHKAIVFMGVFSFILWYRNKYNLAWLGVFITVFLSSSMLAILSGGGRRMLLSVISGPLVAIYFAHLRNLKPAKAMIMVAAAALAIFVVVLMHSSIRHFGRGHEGQRIERTTTAVIQQVKDIGKRNWFERFANNKLFFLSQRTVQYSLITDRFVSSGQLQPQPLNTFKFLLAYPVPRRLWPEKPRTLGWVIVRDVIKRRSSWGVGVAGHAAYEGGPWVALLYAYLAAFGVRMIDDPLRRQPTNPFLIAILATASAHILAWPRGDLSIMTIETAQCFLFAIILGVAGRFLFGTERGAPLPRMAASHVPFVRRSPVR